MNVDIKVKGLDVLEKQLLKLETMTAEKALNGALMSALKPVFDAAKSGAPKGHTGNLKAAITRKRHRALKSRKLAVKGIASTGKSAGGVSTIVNRKKAPHAHLVEFGTGERKKRGKKWNDDKRNIMPANPFMERAWESVGEQRVLTIFSKSLGRRIKRLSK